MATQIDYSKNRKPCLYHRIYLDYRVGLGLIYTEEEIREAKRSPSFAREYDLQWLGLQGNVFSQTMIDKAVELGEKYKDLPINQYALHIGSIDPGFSKITPIYIGELDMEHKIFRIIYHEGFDNTATPEQIANRVHELHSQYINLKWYIDGSNRSFINQLKTKFNESLLWNKPEDVYPNAVRIVPINFVGNHRKMLEHTLILVSAGKVAIPKSYSRLILAMRTAVATEYNLNKESTVWDDDLDDLRLMLIPIKFGTRQ